MSVSPVRPHRIRSDPGTLPNAYVRMMKVTVLSAWMVIT